MTLKPLPAGVSCLVLRGREVYRAVFSFLGVVKALLGSCGGTQCSIRAPSYSESLRWTAMQGLQGEIRVWFAGLTQDPVL